MIRSKLLLTVREESVQLPKTFQHIFLLDGRQAREAAQETSLVIQQVAIDIDKIKCW